VPDSLLFSFFLSFFSPVVEEEKKDRAPARARTRARREERHDILFVFLRGLKKIKKENFSMEK